VYIDLLTFYCGSHL